MIPISFIEAAYQILKQEGKPLSAKEITSIALAENLIHSSGKTPSATIGAEIYADIKSKSDSSRFIKIDRGKFFIRDLERKKMTIKSIMNTFYHGDCLFVLKHDIQLESIDLIYLDPPFFTGKIQKGTDKWHPEAMEISFEDRKSYWASHLNNMRRGAPLWLSDIAGRQPEFAAYLYYIMERLDACKQVLKKTGSIYLHCDWRASHYLKMIMDTIFGNSNFQNEIIWHYTGGGRSKSNFSRKHDTIFWYSRTSVTTFNIDQVRVPYKKTSGYAQGGIISKAGRRYMPHLAGTPVDDVWDIPIINPLSKERIGYPTQKPLALLERIILASSNEGDIILDPFCGCGTTIIAAQKLNRNWIGIDINRTAYEVTTNRYNELPLEFSQVAYVSRDLDEILGMNSSEFEKWVNQYYKATKPFPDKGVDGIAQNNIPIQTKTYEIKYDKLSQFINDAKYHPKVLQPVKTVIAVSQIGFDDSARQLKFKVENTEPLQVELLIPQEMLSIKEAMLL